jgi:hypothetical protein
MALQTKQNKAVIMSDSSECQTYFLLRTNLRAEPFLQTMYSPFHANDILQQKKEKKIQKNEYSIAYFVQVTHRFYNMSLVSTL